MAALLCVHLQCCARIVVASWQLPLLAIRHRHSSLCRAHSSGQALCHVTYKYIHSCIVTVLLPLCPGFMDSLVAVQKTKRITYYRTFCSVKFEQFWTVQCCVQIFCMPLAHVTSVCCCVLSLLHLDHQGDGLGLSAQVDLS